MPIEPTQPIAAPARPARLFSMDRTVATCGIVSLLMWGMTTVPAWLPAFASRLVVKPTGLPGEGPPWLLAAMCLPYLIAYRAVRRGAAGAKVVMGFAALFSALLVVDLFPRGSHDIYLYIFQGRAWAVLGLDAYGAAPARLSTSDPFVLLMGHFLAGLRNAYGPLWTLVAGGLAAAGARLGDPVLASLALFKGIAAAAFLGCAALVARLWTARRSGDDRGAAAAMLLFAWNPVLLYEFVQNGHNDIVMLCFLLLAALLLSRKRIAWAGAALAASVLTKYVTLLCLPFFVACAMRRSGEGSRAMLRNGLVFLAAFAAATVAAYAPFWHGVSTLDGMMAQSSIFGTDVLGLVPFVFGVGSVGARYDLTSPLPAHAVAIMRGASIPIFMVGAAALAVAGFLRVRDERDAFRWSAAMLGWYLLAGCFWLMPWYPAWLFPSFAALGLADAMLVASIGVLFLHGYLAGPVLATFTAALAYAFHRRRNAD